MEMLRLLVFYTVGVLLLIFLWTMRKADKNPPVVTRMGNGTVYIDKLDPGESVTSSIESLVIPPEVALAEPGTWFVESHTGKWEGE